MAFDPIRNVTVLYGGLANVGWDRDETWEYNGSTWTQRIVGVNPGQRRGHAMTFDPSRGKIILTGGNMYSNDGEMWEWNGTTWAAVPGAPGPREFHAMVYDTSAQALVMYGDDDGQLWQGSSLPACDTADFNKDGDIGTDQDIEAFFACLAGHCCGACGSADFNKDGDLGTDQDIESFFRVLAGGSC
jgi:hypothetical protein